MVRVQMQWAAIGAAMSVSLLVLCGSVRAQEQLVAALEKAKTFISVRQGNVELRSVPVLTTSNPTRGAGLDGTMLLWLNQGRPVAAMSIYAWEGRIMHETDSMARTADLTAQSRSGKQWRPTAAGVNFHTLQAELSDSQTDAQRLQKMRNLAKQFEGTLLGFNDQNSDREQLRLLTTPVYRYELKPDRTLHRDLVDGAVFAFVQGTDPEIILVLELVETGGARNWEYALVRATAGALEARLNGKVVFEAAKFPENDRPSLPHFTFSHEVNEIIK